MLDGEGNRAGNYVKSSAIGRDVGAEAIDRAEVKGAEKIKDLEARKRVAARIGCVMDKAQRDGAMSRMEVIARLEQAGISLVFRINGQSRLTGATFIDHNERGVFNGSRVRFPANYWHDLFSQHSEPTAQPESEGQTPVADQDTNGPTPDIPAVEETPTQKPYEQQAEYEEYYEGEPGDGDIPAHRCRTSSGQYHAPLSDEWRY